MLAIQLAKFSEKSKCVICIHFELSSQIVGKIHFPLQININKLLAKNLKTRIISHKSRECITSISMTSKSLIIVFVVIKESKITSVDASSLGCHHIISIFFIVKHFSNFFYSHRFSSLTFTI